MTASISAGLRFGRYEVGDRVGTGGFGMVYRARDVELGRALAIKFLKPEYLERSQVVQRFLQEARAAAKIGHPGIVTVFECGLISGTGSAADGNAFIAMELLKGESLTDRMKRRGRLPIALAVAIGRQLASALAAAHDAGIIHRDLKPDNVYLVPDAAVRGGERVKILDFGVAKLAEPIEHALHTHSRVILGTPRYMSPEQARSASKVDHRSDIYALGCILFEALAGRPPYGGDMQETLFAHQQAPVPSLRSEVHAASVELDQLVASMMAKTPDGRPPSMVAVDDTLGACESTARDGITEVLLPLHEPTLGEQTLVHVRSRPPRQQLRLAALIAGGLVLGGMIMFFAMRRGGRAADVPPPALDAAVAIVETPPPEPPPPPPPPAPLPLPSPAEPPDAEPSQVELRRQCVEYESEERWGDMLDCGRTLAQRDSAQGDELVKRAKIEIAAEPRIRELQQAIDPKVLDLRKARAALEQIAKSRFHTKYKAEYEAAEQRLFDKQVLSLRAKANRNDSCKDYGALIKQLTDAYGRSFADAARRVAPCRPDIVAQPAAPPTSCDAAALKQQGGEAYTAGNYAYALREFEKALACKIDPEAGQRAFMAACNLGNLDKAKYYWKKFKMTAMPALSICVRRGIQQADLEGP